MGYYSRSMVGRRTFLEMNPGPIWVCGFCGELIVKSSGRDSDSLVVHHINENREDNRLSNLMAAHFGCHAAHHMIGWTPSEKMKAAQLKAVKGVPKTPEHRSKIPGRPPNRNSTPRSGVRG